MRVTCRPSLSRSILNHSQNISCGLAPKLVQSFNPRMLGDKIKLVLSFENSYSKHLTVLILEDCYILNLFLRSLWRFEYLVLEYNINIFCHLMQERIRMLQRNPLDDLMMITSTTRSLSHTRMRIKIIYIFSASNASTIDLYEVAHCLYQLVYNSCILIELSVIIFGYR